MGTGPGDGQMLCALLPAGGCANSLLEDTKVYKNKIITLAVMRREHHKAINAEVPRPSWRSPVTAHHPHPCPQMGSVSFSHLGGHHVDT